MPSSHPPIKKYNYERSLFRWLMSRHPEPFEKHGITTKTLERAPLAREAFYRSGWPGAKVLVQNNEDNKFERTEFFDQIIERGLGEGDTCFSVEHVSTDERSTLGITLDSATGKYYLHAYGSAKTRRTGSRRSSATSVSSSDADQDAADPPHPTVKEVGDLIASEIEVAGEDAEVRLEKSRLQRASPSGPTVLSFSISIRRRASVGGAAAAAAAAGGADSGSGASDQRAGDAGATADAGGGDPMGRALPPRSARPAQTVSTTPPPPPPPSAAGAWHMNQYQRQPAGTVSASSSPCTPGMTGARQQQQQHQHQGGRDGMTRPPQQQQQQQQDNRKRDSASVLEADAATLASVSQVGAKKRKEARSRSSLSPPGASATGVASFGSGAGRNAVGIRTHAEDNDAARRMSIAQAQAPFTAEFLETLASLGGGLAKMEPVPRSLMPEGSSRGGGPGLRTGGTSFDGSMSATGSSSSNNGGDDRGRAQQQRRRQPVASFSGGNLSSNRSYLPGMEGIIQPTSSARQHGAFARSGGAAPRPPASPGGWTFPTMSSEDFPSLRADGDGGGGGGGSSGVFTQSPGSVDMGGGGRVRVPPSPPAAPASTSWELFQVMPGFLRHDDLGSQQQQQQQQQHGVARGVADSSSSMGGRVGEVGGREAGGGPHVNAGARGAGVSSSQRFGGCERAAAVLDHGHDPHGGLASLSGPRLCAPFTEEKQQQQQSLGYQAASGGCGSTGMHATWDGGARSGCADPSNSSSSSMAGAWGAMSGVPRELDDMDFLESMLGGHRDESPRS